MSIGEPVALSDVLWAARQVVRQHRELPPSAPAFDPAPTAAIPPQPPVARCAQCDGADSTCRMLVWARTELAAHEAPRRRRP